MQTPFDLDSQLLVHTHNGLSTRDLTRVLD